MRKEKMHKGKYFSAIIIPCCLFNISTVYGQTVNQDQDQTFKKSQKTLNVQLYKKDGSYETKSLEITTGDFSYKTDYQSWKGKSANGKVVSFHNEVLGYFIVNYNLAPVYCSDGIDNEGKPTGGCQELSEGNLLVQLPYFPNGKYADIYDASGKKILTIDLSSKATCNENNKCDQPIEDGENCPQDCKKQEPKIDPAVVAKAGEAQSQAQQQPPKPISLLLFLIPAGVILLIGGLAFWFWKRYRKYKNSTIH